MNTYDYTIVYLDDPIRSRYDIESTLNEYGEKGWELVSMTQINQLKSTRYSLIGLKTNLMSTFKRKKN